MKMHARFFAGLLLTTLVIGYAAEAQTGRRTRRKASSATTTATAPTNISLAETPRNADAKPASVVMLPEGARPQVDTALINPEPTPRPRRRFEVKVVPAAPPGRSRQEIMYTDSIKNRSPQR